MNRHIEQHDVYFGIGQNVADIMPALKNFWPEAEGLHIDCWREVTNVNGFKIKIVPKNEITSRDTTLSLFFMNLGGYRKEEFEEFHLRELVVATSQAEAVKLAKKTTFYLQHGFKGAVAHIDEKYGVDVDEVYSVEEILSVADKDNFRIIVSKEQIGETDEIHLGYTTFAKLKKISD